MKRGFRGITLFELLLVIILIEVLAVVGVKVLDRLFQDARETMETNVVGLVRTGLHMYFIDPRRGGWMVYPEALDSAPKGVCSMKIPCFDAVLPDGGVTKEWIKLDDSTYRSPGNSTNVWTYTAATGNFEKTKL